MRQRFYKNSDGVDIYIENRQICDLFNRASKVAKVCTANGAKLERRNTQTLREKHRRELRQFARKNKILCWSINTKH